MSVFDIFKAVAIPKKQHKWEKKKLAQLRAMFKLICVYTQMEIHEKKMNIEDIHIGNSIWNIF